MFIKESITPNLGEGHFYKHSIFSQWLVLNARLQRLRLCGILVIQIKPQLEKVLKLPEDALTKESFFVIFLKQTRQRLQFHCDFVRMLKN